MEIRLKTADEFRDAHVTIEIRATPEEAVVVYEADKAVETLAANYARARDRVTELETTENALRNRITNLEQFRTEERDRANRLAAEVAELEKSLTEAHELVADHAGGFLRLRAAIEKIVNQKSVTRRLEAPDADDAEYLAEAIKDIQAAMTSQV